MKPQEWLNILLDAAYVGLVLFFIVGAAGKGKAIK